MPPSEKNARREVGRRVVGVEARPVRLQPAGVREVPEWLSLIAWKANGNDDVQRAANARNGLSCPRSRSPVLRRDAEVVAVGEPPLRHDARSRAASAACCRRDRSQSPRGRARPRAAARASGIRRVHVAERGDRAASACGRRSAATSPRSRPRGPATRRLHRGVLVGRAPVVDEHADVAVVQPDLLEPRERLPLASAFARHTPLMPPADVPEMTSTTKRVRTRRRVPVAAGPNGSI